MDFSSETIAAQLGFDQRYGPPPVVRFGIHGGPYHCVHKLDRVLGREVELCMEYLHGNTPSARSDFIKEAKIGGLCHPNLAPTYDFGMMENGPRFFTRPVMPLTQGLEWFVEDCLSLEGHRVLGSHLATAPLHPLAVEDARGRLRWASDRMRWFEEHGFARWTDRPDAVNRHLSAPADVAGRYSSLEKRLADLEQRSSGLAVTGSEPPDLAGERAACCDARGQAFNSLISATLQQNGVTDAELAQDERVVQLRLGRFVEVVLAACRGVAHAHRHGIWHLHLCPDAVIVGEEYGEVYVTAWRNAHVQGTKPPEIRSVGRKKGATWWCEPPETRSDPADPGPASDVFALGGILSFVLHESTPRWDPARRPGIRFRESIMRRTELLGYDTREFALDLEQVCLRALRDDPRERYPRVSDLVAALTECLKRARSNGVA
jgi:hypothetical protein